MSEWATSLAEALRLWSDGKPDLAGRGLQQVVASLQGPDTALWRALVLNQLALVSAQLGHWDYAQGQWKLAQSTWSASGLPAGSSQLEASLRWFADLLKSSGFSEEAERLLATHRGGNPPLLDPWGAPASAAPPLTLPDLTPVASRWDALLASALQAAREGKSDPAMRACDAALQQGVAARPKDGGQILALVYGTEAVVGFLLGDYAQAGQARAEAQRCWSELALPQWGGELHQRFASLLEEGGQPALAELARARDGRRECPLPDPWVDLGSGMQRLTAAAPTSFSLFTDWQPCLEACFAFWSRREFDRGLQELATLQQRLSGEPEAAAPAILLGQLQALFEYAAGHYDAAHATYARARTAWEDLPPGKRREGPFLEQTRSLLTLHGLAGVADALDREIADPSLAYKPELQMSGGDFAPTEAAEADPRESWEALLREAWETAAAQRWNVAQRRAVNAERAARLLGFDDLRVTYALNSQALFAQASGDYPQAEALLEDARLSWRRGAHTVGARTAWSEFCALLGEADWPQLAEGLRAAWPSGEQRSAFDPVLLPLSSMDTVAMPAMAAPEKAADPDRLQLPAEALLSRPPVPARRQRGFPFWLVGLVLLLLAAGLWWKLHGR